MAVDENKIKKIQERYLDLPEDVQKALFSTKTSDAIFEVGKKYGLAIDKMGELADETGLVMLGMTKPNEYIRNLEKRLSLEATKAKEIAEDINQKVFSPIRESLKKIHGIRPSAEPVQPSVEPLRKPVIQTPIPENLPIEGGQISPPYEGGVPPASAGGVGVKEGVGRGISEKVNQILHEHETKKQEKKLAHTMPEQPEDVKVGEIAKPVEPKVEIKPLVSGHIESGPAPIPPISTQSISKTTPTDIPNIFVRQIPNQKPPAPDIIPPPKTVEDKPQTQTSKEAKNLLEKTINDPYKEPIE